MRQPSGSMRSPPAKARGPGPAHSGVRHWWMQRVTAMGLAPLVLYLLASLVLNTGAGYAEARAWIAHPFNATALILVIGTGFYHAALGIQVVAEDYISGDNARLLVVIGARLGLAVLAVLSMFSVLSIAFG